MLLAAVGPRMTAAACAVADGLIAHPLTSRRVAQEQIRPRIAAAARPGFELSCPVLVITGRTDQELDQARAAVRRQIAFYASTPAYRSVLELYGAGELSDRLREMSRAGEWDAMTPSPDDLLREFSVEASAGALAAALHARFDGVLDRILVYAPYPVPADGWVSSCRGRDGPRPVQPGLVHLARLRASSRAGRGVRSCRGSRSGVARRSRPATATPVRGLVTLASSPAAWCGPQRHQMGGDGCQSLPGSTCGRPVRPGPGRSREKWAEHRTEHALVQ